MKIFQLILSEIPSADIRYANELYNGIKIYFPEVETKRYIINQKNILTQDIINEINTYEYTFIHGLNNDQELYIQLYKSIYNKKIVFITNQNYKKFLSSINKEYIHFLLSSCDKIVFNKNIENLYNSINKLLEPYDLSHKFVQLQYIYNPDYTVMDIPKHKEIIQISNKGLDSKYDLFINLFQHKENYLDSFIWKIYGVEKNIQTLSIDKLFIDKETNTISDLTNLNTNTISKTKINIYPVITNNQSKDILLNSYFGCCFDNYQYINYSILDIIYSGTIPIFNIKYAKKIKINNKQSIYDILDGIYINDNSLINTEIITLINKYINSPNTYKSIVQKNIKICDKLFNPKQNIEQLFKNIS